LKRTVELPAEKSKGRTAFVDCWNSSGDKVVKCEVPEDTALDRCIVAGSDGLIQGTHGWSVLVEGCKEKTDPNYEGYGGIEAEDECARVGRSPWVCLLGSATSTLRRVNLF
jgi:hypothetical protein